LKQSRRPGDEDRPVSSRHEHHFLIGTLFVAAGSAVLAMTYVPTHRAVAWWAALPIILVGANISARRTTPAGIRRDSRDVILSPIGQFLFAAELLLPPVALLAVAVFAPTSRVFADSWLHRSQRATTMFAGSAAFWFVVDDSRGLTRDSNAYRTVLACVVAMIVHTLVEAALVSARVALTNGDRATSSIVWTPYAALRDIWELSIGAVAALLTFEHPVLVIVVVPLCCLASEHIRLESRSRLALTDSRTGLLNPRGFEEVADHEWQRAERGMHRISLVLVDLDLLREVNNVHGHRAGDAVIAAVGRILMYVQSFHRCGGPPRGRGVRVAVARHRSGDRHHGRRTSARDRGEHPHSHARRTARRDGVVRCGDAGGIRNDGRVVRPRRHGVVRREERRAQQGVGGQSGE